MVAMFWSATLRRTLAMKVTCIPGLGYERLRVRRITSLDCMGVTHRHA